jgi:ribosomal protein S27E
MNSVTVLEQIPNTDPKRYRVLCTGCNSTYVTTGTPRLIVKRAGCGSCVAKARAVREGRTIKCKP